VWVVNIGSHLINVLIRIIHHSSIRFRLHVVQVQRNKLLVLFLAFGHVLRKQNPARSFLVRIAIIDGEQILQPEISTTNQTRGYDTSVYREYTPAGRIRDSLNHFLDRQTAGRSREEYIGMQTS